MIHDTYLVVQQQLCIVVSIEQYTTVAEQLSKKEASVSHVEQSFTVNVKNHNVYALCSNCLLVFFQKYAYYFLLQFFCGLARGPPGARGPRFIEPPEPPVATPLLVTI